MVQGAHTARLPRCVDVAGPFYIYRVLYEFALRITQLYDEMRRVMLLHSRWWRTLLGPVQALLIRLDSLKEKGTVAVMPRFTKLPSRSFVSHLFTYVSAIDISS